MTVALKTEGGRVRCVCSSSHAPGDGGPRDRGYTPEGKPAEKVMREWFKKDWKAG